MGMVMLALTSFVESTGNEKLPLPAVVVVLLVPFSDERTTWTHHQHQDLYQNGVCVP